VNCFNLRELQLERIGQQTHLFHGCHLPRLQQLDVQFSSASADCIAALLAMTSSLCKLSLSGLQRPLGGVAMNGSSLRSLSLETVPFVNELENINVSELIAQCPNVVNLHLSVGEHLTDAELLRVVQSLTQLRTLSISLRFGAACFLTDKALGNIALHCGATLEWLTLDLRNTSLCVNHDTFTHGALTSMRSKCTKLRTFCCIAYAAEGNGVFGFTPFESVNRFQWHGRSVSARRFYVPNAGVPRHGL